VVNMADSLTDLIYKYWSKAEEPIETAHHLFPYHCLDVAAVANQWWKQSPIIRRSFTQETRMEEEQTHAWVMFFIAMHDFGKLDIRFQMKVPELAQGNYGGELPKNSQSKDYYHGEQGYIWLVQESASYFEGVEDKHQRWLQNWFASTAGHHGQIPTNAERNPPAFVPEYIMEQDRIVREEWIQDLAKLFLHPAGLKFEDIPTKDPPVLLAGFCSVCDWLGSNTQYFEFQNASKKIQSLNDYFIDRENEAHQVLQDFGLLTKVKTEGGMQALYPKCTPRNTQVLIDDLAVQQSLIIIEANTGSGKTEAALAYASRLLAQGFADSITFALPTQATANAMLKRLEKVADKIFSAGQNVILAHGKRDFNERFKNLIEHSKRTVNVQGEDEGGAQCSEWLSSSRKRAFLGQIAVTTVDQVMLSAIKSLQHYFVRSFGVGKSVLIIDEIHAYDAYMYGILEAVIKQQKQAGGSVILLSATLPASQKQSLCKAWGVETGIGEQPYPLILQATDHEVKAFTLAEHEIGPEKCVEIELWQNDDCSITTEQLKRIVQDAEKGAKIGIVCNLVDDAQRYAHSLSKMTSVPVDIFHSRYRYCDRMDKEKVVLDQYGKGRHSQGRILVGTQVIEQSLDIDFDWLISFICPVDLLFQRMGRLHRHEKNERPEKNKKPLCTVVMHKTINLITSDTLKESYGLHGLIYKNIRALWRTQQLLQQHKCVSFPKAYRDWIERVYQQEAWEDESELLAKLFEEYQMEQVVSKYVSKELTLVNTFFSDTEGNASSLTREGEMNLSVIPVMEQNGKRCFLDGTHVPNANDKYNREHLSQNSLGVPNSWRQILPQSQGNLYYLPMQKSEDGWRFDYEQGNLFYTQKEGLQRIKYEEL